MTVIGGPLVYLGYKGSTTVLFFSLLKLAASRIRLNEGYREIGLNEGYLGFLEGLTIVSSSLLRLHRLI